jgi:hypothetical protein
VFLVRTGLRGTEKHCMNKQYITKTMMRILLCVIAGLICGCAHGEATKSQPETGQFIHSEQTAVMQQEQSAHDSERTRKCILDSNVYLNAATFRDSGRGPEEALNSLKIGNPVSRMPFIKAVINQVYFDSEFANLHGEYLRQSMVNTCINGAPQWKPLE